MQLLPAIFGLESTELTQAERALFSHYQPMGYILFARNCETPAQLTMLVAALKELHNYTPLILIDQEGGRVSRLRSPYWNTPPAPQTFADMAAIDMDAACKAAYNNSAEIARSLTHHGINVNCAPMCDLRFTHSHNIIGDRAYGTEAPQVATLARSVAQGLIDHGVLPIIKHLPGHGRATVDSHESLPIVEASIDELHEDAVPFSALRDLPLGMTAHILYTALDSTLPATLSPTVIRYIREEIGFENLLMSDDLCMQALQGSPAELAKQTLEAGCDIVLHCNGKYNEMETICDAIANYHHITTDTLQALFNIV